MVLIVGDLFGTANHGANYMFFDGATCALGTLSVAKYLTQIVYEKNIDGTTEDSTTCHGEECFRVTHMIISGLCLVSLVACTVLLHISLIEDHEEPAVAAGYIIAERARANAQDPLAELLEHAGISASFRLLTTGELTPGILDRYTERVLAEPRPTPDDEALLAVFAQAAVPSSPYAYARDITGETTLGLIEADPMAGRTLEQVLPDRDWVLLQSICSS